jgi:hypothetical protein
MSLFKPIFVTNSWTDALCSGCRYFNLTVNAIDLDLMMDHNCRMADPGEPEQHASDSPSNQRQPIRYRIVASAPLITMTLEGEYLRRQAQELREEFTAQKRDELLNKIYVGDVKETCRAQAELNYYLTMFQVNSSERGTRQLAVGTWVLALATIGLLVATIVLAVTAAKG